MSRYSVIAARLHATTYLFVFFGQARLQRASYRIKNVPQSSLLTSSLIPSLIVSILTWRKRSKFLLLVLATSLRRHFKLVGHTIWTHANFNLGYNGLKQWLRSGLFSFNTAHNRMPRHETYLFTLCSTAYNPKRWVGQFSGWGDVWQVNSLSRPVEWNKTHITTSLVGNAFRVTPSTPSMAESQSYHWQGSLLC